MEQSNIIFLTILIIENLLLLGLTLVWLNRHCSKCQQVKSIEQIFTKLCVNCQPKPKKEKIKVF